jgi:hypothetical protein
VEESLRFGRNSPCFARLLVNEIAQTAEFKNNIPSTYATFLKVLETQRTDKQAGSSTGTSGTTSLVSKGLVAQTLSVATEYGALSESVNKQVVTVQGSLGGVASALVRENLLSYCASDEENIPGESCVHQRQLGLLSHLSFGISFDTSQSSQAVSGTPSGSASGSAQPVTFTVSGHEISLLTARYAVLSRNDNTSAAFKEAWQKGLTSSSASAASGGTSSKNVCPASNLQLAAKGAVTALTTLMKGLKLDSDPEFKDLYDKKFKDLNSKALLDPMDEPDTKLENDWKNSALELLDRAKKSDPNLLQHAVDLIHTTSIYRFEQAQYVACIADKPVLTVEYDNNRTAGHPFTSAIRVIYDQGIGSKWSLAANGGFELYNSQPSSSIPGASRLRDAQLGVEVDWKPGFPHQGKGSTNQGSATPEPKGFLANLTSPTLSATYYFQHQASPAILNVTPSAPLTGITLTGLPPNATQLFAQKGNISIGQLKVTLGSGSARVPFAVSYSNRTELIPKHEWKAQIGVSYDFDSLFASAGSGKTSQ